MRLDQLCSASNTSKCLSASHCDDQTLLVGGCTIQCTAATDCPQRAQGLASWTCQDYGVGIACVRPGEVWGAIPKGETTQWACDPTNNAVVNLCADALTFDAAPALSCPVSTAVLTTGPCIQSCLYTGGCGYGWMCVGRGQLQNGSRIGLCSRTGMGEIGTFCTTDEQCVFGLCENGFCSRDCTADGVCPSGKTCTNAGGPAIEGKAWRICL